MNENINSANCIQCLQYLNQINLMKNDFKLKCDAITNDNNIMKCQIERLINSNHEPLNYQQEMNNCKQRVDILLQTNENLVTEIKRLQSTRNNDRNLCISCSKPLKELQEKVIQPSADINEKNDNVEIEVNHHMDAVCKKYQKLEEALKREQRWSASINKTYLEVLFTRDLLLEENKSLRSEVESLKVKLSGDKVRRRREMVVSDETFVNAEEFNLSVTGEQIQTANPKKMSKKDKKTTHEICCPESITKIQNLLKEIPNTPNDAFECGFIINEASGINNLGKQLNESEIMEDSENWDICSMNSVGVTVMEKRETDNIKINDNMVVLEEVSKIGVILPSLSDKSDTDSRIEGTIAETITKSVEREEKDIGEAIDVNRKDSDTSDNEVKEILNTPKGEDITEDCVPLQAGVDLIFDDNDVEVDLIALDDEPSAVNNQKREVIIQNVSEKKEILNTPRRKDITGDGVILQAGVDLVFDDSDVEVDLIALDDEPSVVNNQKREVIIQNVSEIKEILNTPRREDITGDGVSLQAGVDLVFDDSDVDVDLIALDDEPSVVNNQKREAVILNASMHVVVDSVLQGYSNIDETTVMMEFVDGNMKIINNEAAVKKITEGRESYEQKEKDFNEPVIIDDSEDGHSSDEDCVIVFEETVTVTAGNKGPLFMKSEDESMIVIDNKAESIRHNKETMDSFECDFVVDVEEDILNNLGDIMVASNVSKIEHLGQEMIKEKTDTLKRGNKRVYNGNSVNDKLSKKRRMESILGSDSSSDSMTEVTPVVQEERTVSKIIDGPINFSDVLSGRYTSAVVGVPRNAEVIKDNEKYRSFCEIFATKSVVSSARERPAKLKKLTIQKGDGKLVQKLGTSIAKIFQRRSTKEEESFKYLSKLPKKEYSFERFCHCYIGAIDRLCNNMDEGGNRGRWWTEAEILEVSEYLVPRVMARSVKSNDRGMEILCHHVMECLAKNRLTTVGDVRSVCSVLATMMTVYRSMKVTGDSLVVAIVDVLRATAVPVALLVVLIDRLGFVDYEDKRLSDVTHNWWLGFLRRLYRGGNVASDHLSERGRAFWVGDCCGPREVAEYLMEKLAQSRESLSLVEALWSVVGRRMGQ